MPTNDNATPIVSSKPATAQAKSINAERRACLEEKLRVLYKQYDLETRNEERLRLKYLIQEVEKDLENLNAIVSDEPKLCLNFDELPIVKGDFFGREKELELLKEAWEGHKTSIIQFIAAGGTGKTKLLRYWLDNTRPEKFIAWSFYSQGASEDKQSSANRFFNKVLELFNTGKTTADFANHPETLASNIVELLRKNECLLILDGLEPLQNASPATRGEIKDRALRYLLKSLANNCTCLCIITSRIKVFELSGHSEPSVINYDLHNLRVSDGIKLLRALKVKGSDKALKKAVLDYGCHALSLSLLGNILRWRFDGDIHQCSRVPDFIGTTDDDEIKHAFKVMQAYELWLENQPELTVLYLLGLFDHPIDQKVLQLLWDKKVIGLSYAIDASYCLKAIDVLREEHHLLADYVNSKYIDCHPLVRRYFGRQLKIKHPDSWHKAHQLLYKYYLSLAVDDLPKTLKAMQPLFNAVEHGCAAELHQEVFDTVYWPRISREKAFYLAQKGNFDVDLSVLAHFFSEHWKIPVSSLSIFAKANVLRSAGYRLRALGRITESIDPFMAEQEYWDELKKPKLYDLVEPHLTLGNIDTGLEIAKRSIKLKYQEFDRRLECVAIYARALHQSGNSKDAERVFVNIERGLKRHNNHLKYLSGIHHFRYCELLLEQQKFKQVERRCLYNLNSIAIDDLQIGLIKLLLGKCYFLRSFKLNAVSIETKNYFNESISHLCAAGNQDHIPRGLLARAAFYRAQGNYTDASHDLAEVLEIAEPSQMRLHLTDYHLEMARLLLAKARSFNEPLLGEGSVTSMMTGQEHLFASKQGVKKGEFHYHVTKADHLINETGYHRRDKELAELKAQLPH